MQFQRCRRPLTDESIRKNPFSKFQKNDISCRSRPIGSTHKGNEQQIRAMRIPKTSENHEKLAQRLMQILRKLNQGEKLNPGDLAVEFGVTLRTIQRDLNERFQEFDLQKADGLYFAPPEQLDKRSLQSLRAFAERTGVLGLFPNPTNEVLAGVMDNRRTPALLIKGHHFEDLGANITVFKQLEQAILDCQTISFSYAKSEGIKQYANSQPYKLINHHGIWYLAAKDRAVLKSFAVGKIERLLAHNTPFIPDTSVETTLREEDDIWLSPNKTRVLLEVQRDAANYFKRQKLIPNQVIEREHGNGTLRVAGSVAHPNQILPTVRAWIPHVRILSPEWLQQELEAQLSAYLSP